MSQVRQLYICWNIDMQRKNYQQHKLNSIGKMKSKLKYGFAMGRDIK